MNFLATHEQELLAQHILDRLIKAGLVSTIAADKAKGIILQAIVFESPSPFK